LIVSGFSNGVVVRVRAAVLAETFGTVKLGTVRSLFSMFMVQSIALGPLVVGLLLDVGLTFQILMLGLSGVLFLAILNAQRIR